MAQATSEDSWLDLTSADLSHEKALYRITLQWFGVCFHSPKRLSFEFINNEIEWIYFSLETEPLEAITPNYPKDYCSEEFCEMSPLNYQPPELLDNLSKDEMDRIHPRHITRYFRGNFVIFHKDSIYNHFISQYKGGHEKLGLQQFRTQISQLA
ncbi:hypothetical protein [Bacteroides pyogenes]|uniref:hypothetical protein n=1 Tax=Bacteroides pyogenes TaxID=310300 RepID=UPI001F238F35|nr:hypothetical protein [Bacteroides pyogenes]MCE9106371.1 hypothetical protein [Bacteroides pyogenes]